MQKEQASSSTVLNQVLMPSCVINAKGKKYVGTTDVHGAFQHTNSEGEVIIRLD